MPNRSLLSLSKPFAIQVGEWLSRCNRRGVCVLIYCARRTSEEQDALFAKGRDDLGNRIPGERILTNARAGQSAHNHGLAVDAVPYEFRAATSGDFIEKKLDWTPFDASVARGESRFRRTGDLSLLDARWKVLAEEADAAGLRWAGRWTSFVEYVHFESPLWTEKKIRQG